jgi:sortase A
MTSTLAPPAGTVAAGPAARRASGATRLRTATAPYVAQGALLAFAVLLLGIVAQLVLVSPLQHRAAQAAGFAALRQSLALGTVPVSQRTSNGGLIGPGTPMLLLDIPELGMHDQVVFEGTDADVLAKGPGHRRDTMLPGQAGVSVLMGRAAAYGGPFRDLTKLVPGDLFKVTTGQGTFSYKVLDFRTAGQQSPPLPGPGQSRLVLVTATGTPYLPAHVLRMDADLVGKTVATPTPVIASDSIPADEQPLAGGAPRWWELILWLQALIVGSVGAVWCWIRWGKHQTWIVFVPVLGAVGLQVAMQVTRLLPNLL